MVLRKLLFTLIFTVILLVTLLPLAYAGGPGDLDVTFNGTGIVTTTVGRGGASSVAIQPDGKIVVVGTSRNQNNIGDFVVIRYKSDGSLDESFNGTGIITTSIGPYFDAARAVAIQADGKIVVVGGTYSTPPDPVSDDPNIAVVRYKSEGQLDETFGGTGIVTTVVNGGYSMGFSIAIQPDGKIVVGGLIRKPDEIRTDSVVVRYKTDGMLDQTFNGTGIVTTSTNSRYGYQPLALQPDGKIVIATEPDINGPMNFIVIRYNSNGLLDSTFNGTGVVTTSIEGSLDAAATGLAIQPDGKIIVGGTIGLNGDRSVLVRYKSDGSLDPSLNATGILTGPFTSRNATFAVIVQPDHKILTAGVLSGSGIQSDISVVRYQNDGSLDSSFKGTGVATASVGSETSLATDMAIQVDGKIVVVGTASQLNGPADDKFVVARFLGGPDGSEPVPGITANPPNPTTTTETGGTANFSVVLNAPPTAPVTLTLVSSRPDEALVTPTRLIFSPLNWNIPQTVTVTGRDDFIDDGDIPYTILFNPAVSADPDYNGRVAPSQHLTNLDDEAQQFYLPVITKYE